MKYPIGSERRPLRVAIIGAGPAAFYAAGDLLKRQNPYVEVDMFERLPTPYGLVRGGVAPDHQNIKNVTKIYERIARLPNFRFWGNVTFGKDIHRHELKSRFDSILYAVGAQSDRRMNISGEDLLGSYSATEFVGWYNGHPDYRDLTYDLSVKKVAIIGLGNVAIDVARILTKSSDVLSNTDITAYTLDALKKSQIEEIYLIARRGPVQAACTPLELQALLDLDQTRVTIDPEALQFDNASQHILEQTKDRNVRRNVELFQQISQKTTTHSRKTIHFRFLRSPVEIYARQGRVSGIKLVKNQLVRMDDDKLKAHSTNTFEELPVGMVLRSIGYLGTQLDDVPFDEKRGTIPHQTGRVFDDKTNQPIPGEYVAGWAKRGPSGVIGTNKTDAIETVQTMLEDFKDQQAEEIQQSHEDSIKSWLESKSIHFGSFQDWKNLDQIEVEAGMLKGKPREKVTQISEMMTLIEKKRKA